MSSESNDLKNAPVAFFCYNRLQHAQRTIEALKNNTLALETDVVIFSDAPKNEKHIDDVVAVRAYLGTISGFRSLKIIARQENFGLAKSIIDGVTSVVNEYGHVIVLEDDLVTSPFFLQFMNDGLRFYKTNKNVASIHAYVYPIDGLPETFFMRGADCWGWATWKDQWAVFEADGAKLLSELQQEKLTKRFDFNGAYPFTQMLRDQISGKNNSWAIRWHASAFFKNKLTLYPGRSLVLNIGNDGSGTHCGVTDGFSSAVATMPVEVASINVREDEHAFKMFEQYFRSLQIGLLGRLRRVAGGIVRKFN